MAVNDGYVYAERVGAGARGRTVLDYLEDCYRHSTAAQWSERIAAGAVLLDGRTVTARTRLEQGQRLVWHRPGWREPPGPDSYAVLYQDEDLLGVAKPSGLPTLPGGGFLERTLLHRVRARFPTASPLHRLGRHTSGLVMFARNAAAHASVSRSFALRRIDKRYRALACGSPATDRFEVHQPIGPVPHARLGTVHAAADDGKPSSSRVEVLERREGQFLCDVHIASGRPHQIRIHLAAAGHPLVGDPLYAVGGRPAPTCVALPGDGGYHLHAAELAFTHPGTGRRVVWTCVAPPLLRTGP